MLATAQLREATGSFVAPFAALPVLAAAVAWLAWLVFAPAVDAAGGAAATGSSGGSQSRHASISPGRGGARREDAAAPLGAEEGARWDVRPVQDPVIGRGSRGD